MEYMYLKEKPPEHFETVWQNRHIPQDWKVSLVINYLQPSSKNMYGLL